MKRKSLNLPNLLSIIRVILVPIFVASILFMRGLGVWGHLVPAAIFGITAFTDMLDGKIARKYGLVTDFGKFIDPLADKFMIIGSQIAVLVWLMLKGESFRLLALIFVWVVLVILLRELGVTSLRLVVAGKSGIVVAASMLGKIKTVSQMIGTVVIILEPIVPYLRDTHILSYVAMAVMLFTTLVSGLDYLKAYIPHIDPDEKLERAPDNNTESENGVSKTPDNT